MLKLLQEAIWDERKAQVQLNMWKQKCSNISPMRKPDSILAEYFDDIGRPQKCPTNNRQGLNIWLKEYSMRCWNQTDLGPNTTLAAYHLRVLEKSLNSLRLISLTIKMEIRLRHQIYVRTGGFPGGTSGKEPICQCRRVRDAPAFDPWVRKIPWRRAWQPTPVFLPEESHGQRSLAGHGITKELDMTEVTEHA